MSFESVVNEAKINFPNLQIKYKNESLFMKILGKLMFFNKNFMTEYVTTIGSTVYFPSKSFVAIRPVSSLMILMHELVHVCDSKQFTTPVFSILYLFPQILALLALPLFFINWKIALLFLLFLLPIPAYFRAYFEKRGYLISLYVSNKLSKKLSFNINLDNEKEETIKSFKNSDYYFMWPFKSVDSQFNEATVKINNNQRPFEDPVFDILDRLIDS